MLRSHTCGDLNKKHTGCEVVVSGWVSRIRDHGGVLFIDLRDRYGITQILFNPEINKELHDKAQRLGNEYVIQVKGVVAARPHGTENKSIPTGDVEVHANTLTILNSAKTPPFDISEQDSLSEDLRYRYRFLDLRRANMQKNMIFRHKFMKVARDYMDENGFLDIETPILTKSTPEGARDYVVPSRVSAGKFFALPQSPQLFKQILMVGGIDKYFQIAKCFRDEDLRADRQPEFTQLDVEMSFVEEDDIYALIEGLIKRVFKVLMNHEIDVPFKRISYKQAMDVYGTDKPDIRFDMQLVDLTDLIKNCSFNVFSNAAKKGVVKGINVKSPKSVSRSRTDELTEFVKSLGAAGLVYFKVENNDLVSPVSKFFTNDEMQTIKHQMRAEDKDLLLFIADNEKKANYILDELRRKIAHEEGLIDENKFNFLWVNGFPLFTYNAEEKRWESEHHPFTSPTSDTVGYIQTDPEKVKSLSYDLVLNGTEMASGSIRIHNPQIQKSIFKAIGITDEEAQKRFGFLLNAFEYGAPPHGGIALGLDRLIAVLLGYDSIREIIAFPKTQKAICMLTNAPSDISQQQLKELGVKLIKKL